MAKMTEAKDKRLDRKAGIKEGTARDTALDRKRGLPPDVVKKGTKGKANPFGGKKANPFGAGHAANKRNPIGAGNSGKMKNGVKC